MKSSLLVGLSFFFCLQGFTQEGAAVRQDIQIRQQLEQKQKINSSKQAELEGFLESPIQNSDHLGLAIDYFFQATRDDRYIESSLCLPNQLFDTYHKHCIPNKVHEFLDKNRAFKRSNFYLISSLANIPSNVVNVRFAQYWMDGGDNPLESLYITLEGENGEEIATIRVIDIHGVERE